MHKSYGELCLPEHGPLRERPREPVLDTNLLQGWVQVGDQPLTLLYCLSSMQ